MRYARARRITHPLYFAMMALRQLSCIFTAASMTCAGISSHKFVLSSMSVMHKVVKGLTPGAPARGLTDLLKQP